MSMTSEFVEILRRDQEAQLTFAHVLGNSGAMVSIRLNSSPAAEPTPWPKIDGVTVAAGDVVLVARVGGGYVVLGKLAA